jgi:membrane protease YdiL (CAAX protease family)
MNRHKILYSIFWILLVILLCLAVDFILEPLFDYELGSHPEGEKLSDDFNVMVDSFPWYTKVVFAPLMEEMLCRFPLLLLVLKYGKNHKKLMYLLAMVFSILFGLVHVSNGNLYTLYTVLFTVSLHGFLYGVLVIKTRNIVCPMVVHGANNGISLLHCL